jgi:hypothetical protein
MVARFHEMGHRQVLVAHEGWSAEVDEGMAADVRAVWGYGLPTLYSCAGGLDVDGGWHARYLMFGCRLGGTNLVVARRLLPWARVLEHELHPLHGPITILREFRGLYTSLGAIAADIAALQAQREAYMAALAARIAAEVADGLGAASSRWG